MKTFSNHPEVEPPLILYLSSDKAYLNEVRRNLGLAGFSVVTTTSCAEAVELSAESHLDAILSDYELPQTDALSVFEEIRELHGEQTPPMLILGEYDLPALRNRCVAAGTDGLHLKTESIDTLIERVTSLLRNDDKRHLVEKSASAKRFVGSTDPLTQIATRDYFIRRLKGESFASYREQTPLSVLLISIDSFSKIVDKHGTNRSDTALAQSARLIEGELRSRDCVARYDEHVFAVILPDTGIDASGAVGRRLRRSLSSSEFGDLDLPIKLTVSIGGANRPVGNRCEPQTLLEQAERACAAAWKMGGDRVVADSTMTGAPVILLLGDLNGDLGVVSKSLSDLNVELRLTTSFDEARKILQQLPVAMAMVQQDLPGAFDGADVLGWIKSRFPLIRRALFAAQVDANLMLRAVNEAAIHCFLPMPVDLARLPGIVDEQLFS